MTTPNQVLVYEDARNQVNVTEDAPTQIVVQLGLAQSFTSRYVHTQSSAATSWTVSHPLGGRPQVTVVDTSDTTVIGDVTYNSDTQIPISFTAAFAGNAYLT